MRKTLLPVLLTISLLTACNLPVGSSNQSSQIATRVSQIMTASPVATAALTTVTPSGSQPATTETLAATSTTAPTNTAAPTLSGPTATTPAGDPKNSLGQPAWQSTSDTSKTFYLYENEGTKISDNNGLLEMTGKLNNGWLGWSMTHSHPAQNFYLEATFQTQACDGTDTYGLVFRAPSDQEGYFFSFTCDGKFALEARDFNNNTDNTLIKRTPNGAIHTGSNQTNRMGIMANGDKISLYANGILLQEINDTTYNPEQGFLGVQIAANQTAGFTVILQEIAQWKLS